ncbi:hypothetical protein [Falsirhodobacter deserti]|uniref:hypothetical protein n=1 Tax=Falsirhodobacter deserti TaxID=1365611 RepID=UPI000FE2BE23|nr:hypothetical protein [Falsirhodobacter deserti]
MRHLLHPHLAGLTLLILLALAFATGTSLHAAPSMTEARLEAYMLAGGLADDLCSTQDQDHLHLPSCSLCQLVTATDLPGTGLALPELERRLAAAVILPQVQRAASRARDPAIPPRGPPSLT